MRALFYPVMGLAALAVILSVACLVWLAIRDWRKARAVKRAQWESYIEDCDGGVDVGIQLVARWGRHQLVLRRNPTNPTTIPTHDAHTIFNARLDADIQAHNHNSMRVSGSPHKRR